MAVDRKAVGCRFFCVFFFLIVHRGIPVAAQEQPLLEFLRDLVLDDWKPSQSGESFTCIAIASHEWGFCACECWRMWLPVPPPRSGTNPLLALQKGFLSLRLERKLPSAGGWWAICFLWGSRCVQNCCVPTGEAWLRCCSAGHPWAASQRRKGCLQVKVPAWEPGSCPASLAWHLAPVRCRQSFWAANWRCYQCFCGTVSCEVSCWEQQVPITTVRWSWGCLYQINFFL